MSGQLVPETLLKKRKQDAKAREERRTKAVEAKKVRSASVCGRCDRRRCRRPLGLRPFALHGAGRDAITYNQIAERPRVALRAQLYIFRV